MALVLGELSVILDGNAAKLKGAFDGAQKAMDRFATGVEKLQRKAAAATSALSSVGLAGNKSTSHLAVAARSAEQLSSKLGVLNKTSYTTSTAWQRMGAASLLTNANALGLASTVLKLEAAFLAAGAAAAVGLVYALSRAASASAEETALLDGLTQALARTGNEGATAAAAGFAEYAEKLQMASRFSDDAIVKAAAVGVSMGIPHDRLQDVARAAVDYSTRSGKDLTSSFEMIARAARGQGKELQRAVGPLDQARLKAEGLDYVLESMNAHFAGAGASSVQNYEGRMVVLGHVFDNLVERVGSFIEKNEYINAIIEEVAASFSALTTWLGQHGDSITSWVNTGLAAMKKLGAITFWVVDKIIEKWTAFVAGLNFFLGALLTPIRAATETLGGLLGALASIVAKLSGTRIGKKLGLSSELAQDLARAGSEVESVGENLQNSFFETGLAHAEMLKKMKSGEAGFSRLWDEFTKRIEERARAIRNLPPPPAGAPLPGAGGSGSGTSTPEFLQNTPTSWLTAAPTADEIAAFRAAADQARTDRAVGIVKSNVGGVAGNVLKGAENGDIMGAGLALLASSKQFQAIMDAVNPLLQAFADVIGTVLAPTREIIEAIAEPLTELLQVITPLVELFMMLNGPMLVLQVAAEALGRVIRWVAKGILNAILAFLRGIQRLAKKLHVHIGALDDAIASLKKLRDGMDDAADAAGALAEQIYNAVEGFKVGAYEWAARDPESHGGSPGGPNMNGDVGGVNLGSQGDAAADAVDDAEEAANDAMNSSGAFASSGSAGSPFAGSMVTYINIEELNAANLEEAVDELDRIARRRNIRRTGSPLPPSNGLFGGRKT